MHPLLTQLHPLSRDFSRNPQSRELPLELNSINKGMYCLVPIDLLVNGSHHPFTDSKGYRENRSYVIVRTAQKNSINPLSPNSDQDQFSPNNIHTLSTDRF